MSGLTQNPAAQAWPPERFFWAVLESPGAKARTGVLPAALYEALEHEIPVPSVSLHAVMVPLSGGRLLVCAAKRDELEALPAHTLSLRPSALPTWESPDAKELMPRIELLTGVYEATPLRRARGTRTALVAVAVLLVGLLSTFGLTRRTAAWDRAGEDARAATTALISLISAGTTPVALQRELVAQRSESHSPKALTPLDAAQSLAGLLAVWPKDIEVDASSVSISAKSMSLSLSVRQDARALLAALKAPTGWTLEEPRLSTAGDLTRVSLSLHRAETK